VAIAAQCPHCGKQFQVKDEFAGRKGKCPGCQGTFEVPAKASSSQASQSPASAAKVAAPVTPIAPTIRADQIREQFQSCFQGQLVPPRVGIGRRLGTLLVLAVLLIMPIYYFAVIGAIVGGMYWLAVGSLGRQLSPAIFWTVEAIGGLVLICLLKPLLEPQRHSVPSEPLDPKNESLLLDLLQNLSRDVRASVPAQVRLECSTRCDVRYGRLTIGVPPRTEIVTDCW